MITEKENRKINSRIKGVLKIDNTELDTFDEQVNRFKAGEWDAIEFIKFRLRQGVYGQRQPNVQMIRVKIPFGGLTSEQMEALGDVADEYAPLRKGHLTTRENVQFHSIPLHRVPDMLKYLGEAGLSTREACGNTVRNVVTHPSAGVSKTEVFDVTPYAAAYARHFLRHPVTQSMPRKSKTAFSGSETDEAITAIHDVGFIARIKDGRKGFKVVVGGGLSTMPQIAQTLTEFVPVEDYLKLSEALLRVYNAQNEERKSIMRARIKFTVKRLGIDKLRELVMQELEKDWALKSINIDLLTQLYDEEKESASVPESTLIAPVDDTAYSAWLKSNVVQQRQNGFHLVYVRVERGDISAEQWKFLAEISRNLLHGRARIDQEQNLVFRWVKTKNLYSLYKALAEKGLHASGRETIRDVVSCPGTDSCKLGITSSMGLNKALVSELEKSNLIDKYVEEIHIKGSGCPNSCGQHHIANIGFHGAVIKGKDGQVPAYEIFIGGNYNTSNGPIRFGSRLKTRVPAKFSYKALSIILTIYKAERHEGEKFNDYTDRVGYKRFEKPLSVLKDEVGPLDRAHIDNYMDWGKTTLYRLERGEGECAV